MSRKEGIVENNKSSGALVALKEVSAGLSKEIKVEVVEYRYTLSPDASGKLKLRIEADSFDTIQNFIESLKKNNAFDSVNEKSSGTKPGSEIKIAVIELDHING